MNQTQKTSLVVLALVVVVGAIAYFTWGANPNSDTLVDQNASSTATANGVNGSGATGGNAQNGSAGSVGGTPSAAGLTDAQVAQMIASAKISVPQTAVDVALTNGQASFTDSSTKGTVMAGPVLSKVVTDNGIDVFTDMTITLDGRPGVLHYVALFHQLGTTVTYKSAVLVGDRIKLIGAVGQVDKAVKADQAGAPMSSTLGYILTVNYLDRKNGEALTVTPSVAKTVSLRVKNHVVTK